MPPASYKKVFDCSWMICVLVVLKPNHNARLIMNHGWTKLEYGMRRKREKREAQKTKSANMWLTMYTIYCNKNCFLILARCGDIVAFVGI